MDHVKERLSEYIDGELAEVDRRAVDSHLFNCEECRRELAELKAISKLVSKLRSEPLPEGFMARLEKRRDAERERAVPLQLLQGMDSWWVKPASFAVCTLAVMLVAFDKMNRAVVELAAPPKDAKEYGAPAAPRAFRQKRLEALDQASAAKDFNEQRVQADGHAAPAPAAMPESAAMMPAENDRLRRLAPEKKQARADQPGQAQQRYAPKTSSSAAGFLQAKNELDAESPRDEEAKRPARAAGLLKAKAAAPRAAEEKGLRGAAGRAGAKLAEVQGKPDESQANIVIDSPELLKGTWTALNIPEPPPVVHFEREIVVLAEAKTPGAKAEIVEVREEEARVVVIYKEVVNNIQGQAPSPYGFRVVERTGLPVVFQKQP